MCTAPSASTSTRSNDPRRRDPVLPHGDRDLEGVLARDERALGAGGVPGEEPAYGVAGGDPLGARLPHRLEAELGPHRVDLRLERDGVGRQLLAGDAVGEHVDDRAEAERGGARDVGLGLVPEEPLERAAGHLAELAAGQARAGRRPDAPAPATTWARAAPTSAPGRRTATSGCPSSAVAPARTARRRAAAARSSAGRDGSTAMHAQLRDEPGHRQRALGAAGAAWSARSSSRPSDVGEEARGLRAVVERGSHGGDDEPLLGARAGDVEQPALLGEQRRGRRGVDEAAGLEPVGLQQRAAPADVGPHALLHRRDHDQAPLQPLGPVGGEQAHGRARARPSRRGCRPGSAARAARRGSWSTPRRPA